MGMKLIPPATAGETPAKPVGGDDTLPAREMVPGALYMTANKPTARYPIRWIGVRPNGDVIVKAYYANVQSWSTLDVPPDYKVRYLKENEQMKIKAAKAATAAAPRTDKPATVKKTIGKTTGVGIFDTWAIGFQKHGKDPKAVVAFMKAEYPVRTTDWAKWVNGMRQRYNAGKLGVTPKEHLAPYHMNGSAKPKAKAKK